MNAATLDFIRQHAQDDVRQLALRSVPAEVDLRAALTQIEGRQLAAHKLPMWAATDGLLFPPRLALEQCSSEATAQYKRQLVLRLLEEIRSKEEEPGIREEEKRDEEQAENSSFVDLTAGLGVDFAAIAPLFAHATYVDRQETLCDLARHNLPLLGLPQAVVRCSTAEEELNALTYDATRLGVETSSTSGTSPNTQVSMPPHPGVRILMIDPARRDAAGRKVALIEDCMPDVCILQGQLRTAADFVLIKLSPMLDLTAALRSLQGVVEVHVVSVGGECKELLLVLSATATTEDPFIYCSRSLEQPPFLFRMSEERDCRVELAVGVQDFLYEPDAALLKAGAFKLLCRRYPVRKLAADTHLYTSSELVADFPGRRWKVVDSCTFAKSELRRLLSDVPAANLTLRGFPGSVATLRKQLRLREGGSVHLIATTLADGSRHLLRVERI